MDAPRRRINRNIVECKVELMMNAAKEYIVLIETSWNVKSNDVIKAVQTEVVLIETSWNVKAAPTIISPANGERVLIETSWNVKDYESRCESVKEYSINRNIVECKGCITAVGSRHNVVLIETSWNVKILG